MYKIKYLINFFQKNLHFFPFSVKILAVSGRCLFEITF